MMRWDKLPAPFEVPPDKTSMSQVSSALRIAASSFSSSSATAPSKNRLAAVLVHRRRDDGAVGVVDFGRTEPPARLHQFVAGGDHGDARPARDDDLGNPAGRAHADLTRADHGAGAQQRLAARDIGAGIGHELPRRGGTADLDRARANRLGVLDHDDGVGAARQRAAGCDRSRRSLQNRPRRRGAAGDDLVVQLDADRRGLGGSGEIGGAHRKAVDIGAVVRAACSMGATISCASVQPSASESGRGSLGIAFGKTAASNR